jgi:hypothetical protein
MSYPIGIPVCGGEAQLGPWNHRCGGKARLVPGLQEPFEDEVKMGRESENESERDDDDGGGGGGML